MYGCLFITPPSQVIQKRRNRRRKEPHGNTCARQQGPIPPRHVDRSLCEPLLHCWPQVTPQFNISHGWQGFLQQLLYFFHLSFTHGCTPPLDNSLRKTLTPRNTLSFTAVTEIPSAFAMSS